MSLELRSVTKRFGSVTAVDRVDLTVSPGELLAVVGPSGCGKTTLIRMVSGLERPDAGSVFIAGRDATDLAPERRNVGIVFQNFALFPHMNVEENVGYGLRWRPLSRAERERRVAELIEMVGLAALRRRRPDELSAGQQQRVALARALAPRPQILLLDEPFSALDADLRERLRLEIRRIQRELGITTILVTHDQEEALGVADRVAVMNQGALVQVGDPWQVYDAPATPFVARFIGKGNFVEARVDQDGADLGPLGRVPRERLSEQVEAGGALVFVRPESVHVVGPQATASAQSFSRASASPQGIELVAELEDITFTGHLCTLHFRVDGRPFLVSLPGPEAPRMRGAVGRPHRLRLPYEALRWLPLE